MAQRQKTLIYYIYEDLVGAVTGIAKKTFLDRPKSIATECTDFVVVNVPSSIIGAVKGKFSVMARSHGTFHLFVKSKTDGTPNIGKQTDLTNQILNIFPINTDHIVASKPIILMKGTDGNGYHVTTVMYDIRTKFNIDK